MRIFLKLLPFIFSLAVLLEGTHYGMLLQNMPSDGAVLGGVILSVGSVAAFFSFNYVYYVQPFLKELR